MSIDYDQLPSDLKYPVRNDFSDREISCTNSTYDIVFSRTWTDDSGINSGNVCTNNSEWNMDGKNVPDDYSDQNDRKNSGWRIIWIKKRQTNT